jgi:lipopolysaccharide export system protein LptA
LTPDERRIDQIELHGGSRITGGNAGAGGLERMTGRDITLKYGPDGQALQHALVDGDAVIELAGDTGRPGRQITANTVDVALASDGSTPTAVVGRGAVTLTFPAEQGGATRTIHAATLDAKGQSGRGLTNAQFNGNVQYRERSGTIDRAVSSGTLDAALKPGLSAIEEARFAHVVRFEEGKMATLSALARYDLDKGLIELTGAEPGVASPHVVNEQISVDATRIDVTLVGPKMRAVGNVKSVLQPPKSTAQKDDGRLPSLLKQDQPVNVTGDDLNYDGAASRAAYTGKAQLWQGDTSVRADTLVIDNKTGDLNASGSVATSVMLEQGEKDKKRERVRSIATAKDFKYEESVRRATYSDGAHLSGPQGDMTAATIELYLKPSGDELDRAEASDNLTLREQNRKTVGSHMTYTAADERYVVIGAPVSIVDQCGRESIGKTLTFVKATDTIEVDGNERIRTQTKGGSKCP